MKLGKSLINAALKSKLLHSCPICSSLGDDSLSAIAEIAVERTFEKGQYIMQEGDLSTGFFLVLAGKIRVFKSSANGKEKVLLIAETGMTFGEDALFGQGTFLQSAEAAMKSKVLQIPRNEFLNMLRKDSELSFQVMESLCMWIRRLSSSVENVAFLTAKDKVAQYLVELGQKSKTSSVTLPAKKKEIADQLGITPETLSRILSDFSKQKVIKIEKQKISILNLSQLSEV